MVLNFARTMGNDIINASLFLQLSEKKIRLVILRCTQVSTMGTWTLIFRKTKILMPGHYLPLYVTTCEIVKCTVK